MELQFWAGTDFGKTRDHNEDNYLVDRNLQLFVVCDGMGGHAAGEVASAISAQTVRESVYEYRQLFEQISDEELSDHERKKVKKLLEFAVKRANSRVHKSANRDAERQGMGTTCSALLIYGDRGFVGHVGDSRIYRVRDAEATQLTDDHSLLNELIEAGKLEEGDPFPHKNAVTRAVGVQEEVEVDTFDFEIEPRDRFLLCSDGLCNYFEEDGEVVDLIGTGELKSVIDSCIEFANEAGGEDNITAVVVSAHETEQIERAEKEELEVLDQLEQLPYFQYLNSRELIEIGQVLQLESIEAGQTLIDEDPDSHDLYLVLEGRIGGFRDDNKFAEFGKGDYFGELALLDCKPPGVSFKALDSGEAGRLETETFLKLMRENPSTAVKVFWNFSQVFAGKFRALPTEVFLNPEQFSQLDVSMDDIEVTESGRMTGEESRIEAFDQELMAKVAEEKSKESFEAKNRAGKASDGEHSSDMASFDRDAEPTIDLQGALDESEQSGPQTEVIDTDELDTIDLGEDAGDDTDREASRDGPEPESDSADHDDAVESDEQQLRSTVDLTADEVEDFPPTPEDTGSDEAQSPNDASPPKSKVIMTREQMLAENEETQESMD